MITFLTIAALSALLLAKRKSINGVGATLSPYKIWWIVLIPESGIATKKDMLTIQRMVGGSILDSNRLDKSQILMHFASKKDAQRAFDELANFDGELTKNYTGYMFSDKQFAMWDRNEPIESVLTAQQMENEILVS